MTYKSHLIKLLVVFIFFAGMTYLNSVYAVRRELSVGKQSKILYSSLPSILQERYSEDWVKTNIAKNGDIK